MAMLFDSRQQSNMSTVKRGAQLRVQQIRELDRPGGKFIVCSTSVIRSVVEID